jgi:hypothetical protein
LACHLQIDADPDSAYHFDADLDPAYHLDADPDPHEIEKVGQHCFYFLPSISLLILSMPVASLCYYLWNDPPLEERNK